MNDIVCVPFYVLEYICFLAGVDSHVVTDQCSVVDSETLDEIEPHSDDYVDSEQNVVFHDADVGHTGGTMGIIDDIRDEVMVSDASLQDFFSRPITIASYNWTVGGTLDDDVWPWEEYFKNPRVVNRISNFKLLSCKLCIKVVVNGTPFHYGRAIMSYAPMSTLDDLTIARTGVSQDIVALSQMPHVYIDPTTSEGGTLQLPFLWWKNSLDITTSSFSPSGFTEFKQMGQLRFRTINELKHANDGLTNVTVRIFAWAEDVKMAVPTATNPEDLVTQAGTIVPNSEEIVPHAKGGNGKPKAKDEYTGGGIISTPATVVASIARKLADAPIIGKYARATEIGANAVAGIASLFGFSRPTMLTSSRFRRETKSNMAVTNVEDDVIKLTVDSKQELSIDPSIFGLSDIDEMEIKHLAQKESYLTTFNWTTAGTAETLLFQTVVDPGLKAIFGSEFHLTALSFTQLPFKLWRGTMRFRFQVVCSAYHRGRLKFVWDPEKCPGTTAEYNVAYTTVVDISNGSDFTIDVGWGQPFSYTNTMPFLTPQDDTFTNTSTPLFYTSSEQEWGNGVLAVYVVNELVSPKEADTIEVNVFVSGGDDFEVAMPSGEVLTRLRYRDTLGADVPVLGDIEPQSDEVAGTKDAVQNPLTADTDAATLSLTDCANLVHFGESIRSFRQLVKRYNRHETVPLIPGVPVAATPYMFNLQRPILPFEGGRTNKGGVLPPVVTAGGVPYAYANLTLVRYLTTAFVGWRGGMRYLVTFPDVCCSDSIGPIVAGRYDACVPENGALVLNQNAATNAHQSQYADAMDDVAGVEGFYVQNLRENSTLALEFPFYSRYRFMPGRYLQSFNISDAVYAPCWKLRFPFVTGTTGGNAANTVINFQNKAINTFVAAAEDFTVGMFLAAPVVYFESSPPT
nr:MAG: structural polyprotein [Salisharnavirus sp.]